MQKRQRFLSLPLLFLVDYRLSLTLTITHLSKCQVLLFTLQWYIVLPAYLFISWLRHTSIDFFATRNDYIPELVSSGN